MKLLQNKAFKTTILSTSVAFLAFAGATLYKTVNNPPAESLEVAAAKSVVYNEGNYNKLLQAKGFEAVEVDKEKPHVFVIEYTGGFDKVSMVKFNDNVERVWAKAKKGDKLILDIDSHGGSASSCFSMANEVDLLSDAVDMHVTATIDHAAGSCGYYLALSADDIIMAKSASVGNIGALRSYAKANKGSGVVGMIVGNGNEVVTIGSTRIKELLAGAPVKSVADEEFHKLLLSKITNKFFDYVRNSRGDRLKDEKVAFSALSFYYEDAVDVGLVDGSGTTRSVLIELYKSGHKITKIN